MLRASLPGFDAFEERDAVRGAQLVGRDAEVSALRTRIMRGDAVGLFGLRKMGKTSVMRAVTDQPAHVVARDDLVGQIEGHLRRGVAVKLVGGRGMGKSVLLRQVAARFADEPDTRAVLVPGPPEEGTLLACVQDIAMRLGLDSLARSMTRRSMLHRPAAASGRRAGRYIRLDTRRPIADPSGRVDRQPSDPACV